MACRVTGQPAGGHRYEIKGKIHASLTQSRCNRGWVSKTTHSGRAFQNRAQNMAWKLHPLPRHHLSALDARQAATGRKQVERM